LLGSYPLPQRYVKGRHDADVAAKVSYSAQDSQDLLAGELTLSNAANGASATLPMMAWSAYENENPLQIGTTPGFGSEAGTPASTNTAQLEDTFWYSTWDIPFDHERAAMLISATFPTRRAYDGLNRGQGAFGQTAMPSGVGLYAFDNVTGRAEGASVEIWDRFQHRIGNIQQLPDTPPPARAAFGAVGFLPIGPGDSSVNASNDFVQLGTLSFTAGSVRLNFSGQADAHNRMGIPAVVTAIYWRADSNRMQASWLFPPHFGWTYKPSN
jgi:hypothetical protein